MAQPFTKPAMTYGRQIAILEARGTLVEDHADAAFYLEHLNYYRLRSYWLPFESNHATHQFRPGTISEQVALRPTSLVSS